MAIRFTVNFGVRARRLPTEYSGPFSAAPAVTRVPYEFSWRFILETEDGVVQGLLRA
jgi:hypothetical protein